MKTLTIILLLFTFTVNAQIKPDKYYHAGAGAGIAISSHLILKGDYVNPYKGTLITLPIAAGKEFADSFNGRSFSFVDIGATLIFPVLIDTGVLIYKSIKKRRKVIDPFDWENELVLK